MATSLSILAALSFVSPAMLLGAVLVGLPILAHLLNRRVRRKVVFPSLMLLAASSASQSQLFKLRRWLLLLLRALAVILLVLAFARPLWQASEAQAVGEQGAAVVLVVDVSASTGQQQEGVTAIQSLAAAAGRALDGLLTGADAVNLVYADSRPEPAFATLTANVEAVRQELQSLESTAERADWPAALAKAGELLAQRQGPHHLVILSDFQASNWQDLRPEQVGELGLPPGTRISLVPLESAPPGNVTLRRGGVSPWPVVVDQSARATVELVNGSDHQRTVPVTLMVDGQDEQTRSVALQPGQQRELAFDLRLAEPGEHRLTFSLPEDGLAVDNRLHLSTSAVTRVPVVVIGDDAPDEPGTATYFLLRALSPRGDRLDRYEVRHVTSTEASWRDFEPAAAVLVSYVGPMPERLLEALHRHLQRGGGVVVFCGEGPVQGNLHALAKQVQSGLSWQVAERQDLSAFGDALTLQQGDWQSRLLSPFDLESRSALQRIRFARVWALADVPEATQVLLRFADGTPALGSRSIGPGRLVLANFSPALRDSDLGKYGSFVALTQRLVEVLRPSAAPTRPAIAGQTLTLALSGSIDPARPPRVVGPEGQTLTEAELTRTGEQILAAVPAARQPGFYTVMQEERPLQTAAVNVDPREGDLHRLDPQRVRELLNTSGHVSQVQRTADESPLLQLRGQPLWGWMVAAALVALGLEMALVGWWRR